jgi:hypothetical protein
MIAKKVIQFLLSQKDRIDWNLTVKDKYGKDESLLHFFLRKNEMKYIHLSMNATQPIIDTAHEIIRNGYNPYISRDGRSLRGIDWLLYWHSPSGASRLKEEDIFLPCRNPPHWDKSFYLRFSNAVSDLCQPLIAHYHFVGSHVWSSLSFPGILAAMHHPEYRACLFRDLEKIKEEDIVKLGQFLQYVFVSKEQYRSILENDFRIPSNEVVLPKKSYEALEHFNQYGCLPDDVIMQFFSNFNPDQFVALMKGITRFDLKEITYKRREEILISIQTQEPWKQGLKNLDQSSALIADLKALLMEFSVFCLNQEGLSKLMRTFPKDEQMELEFEEQNSFIIIGMEDLKQMIGSAVTICIPLIENYFSIRLKELENERSEILNNLEQHQPENQSDTKVVLTSHQNLNIELNLWIRLLEGFDQLQKFIPTLREYHMTISLERDNWLRRCENVRSQDAQYLEKQYEENDSALLIANLVGSIQESSMLQKNISKFLGVPFEEIYVHYHITNGKDLKVLGLDIPIESLCDQIEMAAQGESRNQKLEELMAAIQSRKEILISLNKFRKSSQLDQAIKRVKDLHSEQEARKWDKETRGLMLKEFLAQPSLKEHLKILGDQSLSEWIGKMEEEGMKIQAFDLYRFEQLSKAISHFRSSRFQSIPVDSQSFHTLT